MFFIKVCVPQPVGVKNEDVEWLVIHHDKTFPSFPNLMERMKGAMARRGRAADVDACDIFYLDKKDQKTVICDESSLLYGIASCLPDNCLQLFLQYKKEKDIPQPPVGDVDALSKLDERLAMVEARLGEMETRCSSSSNVGEEMGLVDRKKSLKENEDHVHHKKVVTRAPPAIIRSPLRVVLSPGSAFLFGNCFYRESSATAASPHVAFDGGSSDFATRSVWKIVKMEPGAYRAVVATNSLAYKATCCAEWEENKQELKARGVAATDTLYFSGADQWFVVAYPSAALEILSVTLEGQV